MSNESPFTWIISSQRLEPETAGVRVHVQGQAGGEYLTILAADGSGSQAKSFLEDSSIKSVLSYTEVPGGQGPRAGAGKAGLLVVVGLTPLPEEEEDLNAWYRDEHVTMLSKVPGWIMSQRLKATDSKQDGPQYLALHFYEKENGTGTSQEFKDAVTTPWCAKVIGSCQKNGPNGFARWEWGL